MTLKTKCSLLAAMLLVSEHHPDPLRGILPVSVKKHRSYCEQLQIKVWSFTAGLAFVGLLVLAAEIRYDYVNQVNVFTPPVLETVSVSTSP